MKLTTDLKMKLALIATGAGLVIVAALLLSNPATPVTAQNVQAAAGQRSEERRVGKECRL